MVQADGFVDTDQGRVTFALEAHLDGQGTLVGKLELHDHGSGFSIRNICSTPVVRAS